MTRHELIVTVWNRLSEDQGKRLTKKLITKIVKTTFEVLSDCVLRGELIRIPKFGSFRTKCYASKASWSCVQNKLVNSRPYMKVNFTISKGLKRRAKQMLEEIHEKIRL